MLSKHQEAKPLEIPLDCKEIKVVKPKGNQPWIFIGRTDAGAEAPILSVQFSAAAQSCPTLCDPMNHSTPGFPVHHQLPESTQTHVHCVSDAIQPSHPLSSPSPPALNPSQHQGLFKWVSSLQSIGVLAWISVLPMNTQDWSPLGWTGLSRVFSNTTLQKHQFFSPQLSF